MDFRNDWGSDYMDALSGYDACSRSGLPRQGGGEDS